VQSEVGHSIPPPRFCVDGRGHQMAVGDPSTQNTHSAAMQLYPASDCTHPLSFEEIAHRVNNAPGVSIGEICMNGEAQNARTQ